MSEQTPESANHVKFSWGSDPESKMVHLLAYYEKTRIHVDFCDDGAEGTANFEKTLNTLPTILGYIRTERLIDFEASSIDQELEDLLGDDNV